MGESIPDISCNQCMEKGSTPPALAASAGPSPPGAGGRPRYLSYLHFDMPGAGWGLTAISVAACHGPPSPSACVLQPQPSFLGPCLPSWGLWTHVSTSTEESAGALTRQHRDPGPDFHGWYIPSCPPGRYLSLQILRFGKMTSWTRQPCILGSLSGCHQMFSSVPALYPVNASEVPSPTFPVTTIKRVSSK